MQHSDLPAAVIKHLEVMIREREDELASYKDGSQHVLQRAGGDWVDITQQTIDQIEREIAAWKCVVQRHKTDHS